MARTPIMGFRDDVIVRVRPFEGGARVDVRSSSRYGSFDFGANAARVRRLLEDIEAEIANQAPDEPPPIARPKGPAKGAPKSQPKAPPKSRSRSADRQPVAAVERRRAVGRDLAARSTRSSRCASTDRPAAAVSRGSRPT